LRGIIPGVEIARHFGVAKSIVSRIHTRKLWAHLQLEEPTPC
jgi:hypothetical protein